MAQNSLGQNTTYFISEDTANMNEFIPTNFGWSLSPYGVKLSADLPPKFPITQYMLEYEVFCISGCSLKFHFQGKF